MPLGYQLQSMGYLAVSTIMAGGFLLIWLRTRRLHFFLLTIGKAISTAAQLFNQIIYSSRKAGIPPPAGSAASTQMIQFVVQGAWILTLIIMLIAAIFFIRDEMRRAGSPHYGESQ